MWSSTTRKPKPSTLVQHRCLHAGITHAGNGRLGIYYVNLPHSSSLPSSSEQVVRLDPNAAKQTVIIRDVQPRVTSDTGGLPAAALGRSVYFLDPQQLDYPGARKAPIVQGQAVLYRLTPRSR